VFCGKQKVSREHVIPSWVEKTFPPRPPGVRLKHTTEGVSFEADALSWTVKRVCRNCNSGWMNSEVEQPAAPILTEMIHGNRVALTTEQQKHVATWAIKTHLMAQYRHTPFRPAPENHLRWMYEQKSPVPNSQVWLGAYGAKLDPVNYAWGRTTTFEMSTTPPEMSGVESVPAGDEVHVQTFTLRIGHLIFQTVKRTEPEDGLLMHIAPDMERFLVPIWPNAGSSVDWPPPMALYNEQGLSNLSDRFAPSLGTPLFFS
jgi:hypothetical protein